MPGAREVRAGRAVVELLTDNSPLVRGLKNARTLVAGWSKQIATIGTRLTAPLALVGAAGAAGAVLAAERIAMIGDRADKAAGRMGITVEAMTELDHAAQRSGSNLETLEVGLATMGKNAREAALGNAANAAEFARLGINVVDFLKLSPDRQLEVLADRLQTIQNPTLRSAAAMKILGESGRKLLPMLAGGSAGIRQMRQEANILGVTMSGEDATAAAKFIDAMTDLRAAATGTAVKFAAALFPTLTNLVNFLARSMGAVAKWVKENRAAILVAVAVGAGIAGIGIALVGLSVALSVAGTILGAVAAAFTTIGAVIGFILSPIGLVTVAVGGLAAYLLTMTNVGKTALAGLSNAWNTVAGDATSAWSGIVAAIGAGDLSAAFAVGVAFIQLEWVRLTNYLGEKWSDFKEIFMTFWTAATNEFAKLFTDATADLEIVWIHTTDFLADAWDAVTNRFKQGWQSAQGVIAKGIGYLIAKLQGLDPAEVLAEIDAETSRNNRQTQAGTDQRVGDRATARSKRLQEIESERVANKGEINADEQRSRLQRIAKSDQEAGRRDTALTAAQKRLTEAVDRARKARAVETTARTQQAVDQGQAGVNAAVQQQATVDAVDIRTAEGLSAIIAGIQGNTQADQMLALQQQTATATQTTATATASAAESLRTLADDAKETISIGGGP